MAPSDSGLRIASVLALLLTALFGSGCFERDGHVEGEPRAPLFDTSVDTGPPGPLREAEDEVRYWAAATDANSSLAAGCPAFPVHPQGRLQPDIGFRIYTWDKACGFDEKAIGEAEEATHARGDFSIVAEWRARASRVMNESALELSNLTSFNNVSSVEVAAVLMSLNLGLQRLWLDIEEVYPRLLAGEEDDVGLVLATYGMLESAGTVHLNVLSLFPNGGNCTAGDEWSAQHVLVAYRERLTAAQLAAEAHPGELADYAVGSIGARLERLRTAEALGWWPYIMAQESYLPVYDAYDIDTPEAKLPSAAEAEWLWRTYANGTRSIWTDLVLEQRVPEPEERLWSKHPQQAALLLALDELAWPFEALACGGSEPSPT